MGTSCCSFNSEKINEIKNTIDRTETENYYKNIISTTRTELKLEETFYEITEEDIQLNKIINQLKFLYNYKIKVFTEIELINLAIYFKDNSDNNYLIFDMRISSEQSQNYLKKIKHINYTFQQIREIDKINKKEILYNFIDNKTIIIITSKKYLNPIYKKENNANEDYAIEISNLLYNINNNISFRILNSCFDKIDEKKEKFVEYLSLYYDKDFIPYILFTYKHLTTFYNEGYFFINFNSDFFVNMEKYMKVLDKIYSNAIIDKSNFRLDEDNIKYKFLYDMNITTIIRIPTGLNISFEIKEYQYQKKCFREISLRKIDLFSEIKKINEFINWVKTEVLKGHSCYFIYEDLDIKNSLNSNYNDNYDWIFIVVFFILMITNVELSEVISYLNEKMIYYDNVETLIEEKINSQEVMELMSKYRDI